MVSMIGYRLCLLGFIGLLLSGCAGLPRATPLTVVGLSFHNATSTPIHNAKLSVSKTHGMIGCGIILSHKECSTTFPQRQYQGNAITVSWEQAGQTWTAHNVEVQLPEYPIPDRPSTAVITLGEHGAISARLVQLPSKTATPLTLQPE